MKWIKVDSKSQLPDREVLAVNNINEFLVGHINFNGDSTIYCEGEGVVLENVKCYVLISELEKSLPK